MSRFKVVVTDQVFPDVELERGLLAEIDASLEVADGSLDDALARGRDADALLNTYLPLDANVFAQLERCRIVARYGIGVDNVDLTAAQQAGVVVTNVPTTAWTRSPPTPWRCCSRCCGACRRATPRCAAAAGASTGCGR